MRARCVIFRNAPPAKAGCLRFVAFMTGRRLQRVAYHFAPSHRGTTTKWAAVLPLILNLTAASSLALCTASRHTPTRFYLCAAPFLHRSCCCPSSRSISHLSQTSQGCGFPASSGFKSCTLRLFCKLTSLAIVLFKTFDQYQGKSSRSFFVHLTFDARYVAGDRDVNSNCSRQ